jgi:hypothetical protein
MIGTVDETVVSVELSLTVMDIFSLEVVCCGENEASTPYPVNIIVVIKIAQTETNSIRCTFILVLYAAWKYIISRVCAFNSIFTSAFW